MPTNTRIPKLRSSTKRKAVVEDEEEEEEFFDEEGDYEEEESERGDVSQGKAEKDEATIFNAKTYFTLDKESQKYICDFCNSCEISSSSGTSTLMYHLASKHQQESRIPIEYRKYLINRNEELREKRRRKKGRGNGKVFTQDSASSQYRTVSRVQRTPASNLKNSDGAIDVNCALFSEPQVLSGKKKEAFINAVECFLLKANLPLSFAENLAFQDLLSIFVADEKHALGSLFPSRRNVVRDYEAMVDNGIKGIKEYLATIDCGINVTTDAWSTKMGKSVIGINIGFVDEKKGDCINFLLGFIEVHKEHSGDNIMKKFFEGICPFDITSRLFFLTLDGASNNFLTRKSLEKKMGPASAHDKYIESQTMVCKDHIICNCLKHVAKQYCAEQTKKLNRLAKLFRKSSKEWNLLLEFYAHDEEVQGSLRRLPGYDPGRFDSWNEQLKVYLKQKDVLRNFLNSRIEELNPKNNKKDIEKRQVMEYVLLTEEDETLIEDIFPLVSVCHEVSLILRGEKYCTVSEAYLAIESLSLYVHSKIETSTNSSNDGKDPQKLSKRAREMFICFKEQLEKKDLLNIVDAEYASILVDPFKSSLVLKHPQSLEKAVTYLKKVVSWFAQKDLDDRMRKADNELNESSSGTISSAESVRKGPLDFSSKTNSSSPAGVSSFLSVLENQKKQLRPAPKRKDKTIKSFHEHPSYLAVSDIGIGNYTSFHNYLEKIESPKVSDVITFWKENYPGDDFKPLRQAVYSLITIRETSTTTERTFSRAKLLEGHLRHRTGTHALSLQMRLHSWLKNELYSPILPSVGCKRIRKRSIVPTSLGYSSSEGNESDNFDSDHDDISFLSDPAY